MSPGEGAINAADRQAAVNVLKARTSMTDAEANETISKWSAAFDSAKAQFQQAKVQAEQKAREIGDAAARGTAQSALWVFAALILGALAAALGGYVGTNLNRRRGYENNQAANAIS